MQRRVRAAEQAVEVIVNDGLIFLGDLDGGEDDLVAADNAAAVMIRRLAARLENAGYQAGPLRVDGLDAATAARAVDRALAVLADAMSEMEVADLVDALRHVADVTQSDPGCAICGSPTQAWSLLDATPCEGEAPGDPKSQSGSRYAFALCAKCSLALHQTQ